MRTMMQFSRRIKHLNRPMEKKLLFPVSVMSKILVSLNGLSISSCRGIFPLRISMDRVTRLLSIDIVGISGGRP
jgi:hypothetical protein